MRPVTMCVTAYVEQALMRAAITVVKINGDGKLTQSLGIWMNWMVLKYV